MPVCPGAPKKANKPEGPTTPEKEYIKPVCPPAPGGAELPPPQIPPQMPSNRSLSYFEE